MRSMILFLILSLSSFSAFASDIRCQGSGRFGDIHIYNDVNFVSANQAPLLQTEVMKVSVKIDPSTSPAQLAIEVEDRAPNGNLLGLHGAKSELNGPVQYMDAQDSIITCVNTASLREREIEANSKLYYLYKTLRGWL